jgi:hypothetical protein
VGNHPSVRLRVLLIERCFCLMSRMAIAAVVLAVTALPLAAQAQQSFPLDVNVGDAGFVSATVVVEHGSSQNRQLLLTASVSGSATIRGISATIASQPITVTASATCHAGTATLTLNTSTIDTRLATGQNATIAPLQVVASATCGRTPTLTVSVSAATIVLSDGTVIQTSPCTVYISNPSRTNLGVAMCQVHDLIYDLATMVANGASVTDIVNELNQILVQLQNGLKG